MGRTVNDQTALISKAELFVSRGSRCRFAYLNSVSGHSSDTHYTVLPYTAHKLSGNTRSQGNLRLNNRDHRNQARSYSTVVSTHRLGP